MPTGLHCLLVAGMDYWQDASIQVTCGRDGMAGSVTEAWSHDKGWGWQKCNRSAQECNGRAQSITGGMEAQRLPKKKVR